MNGRREQTVTYLLVASFVATFFAAVHLPGRSARNALHEEIRKAQVEIQPHEHLDQQLRNVKAERDRHDAYLAKSSVVFTEPHEVLASVHRTAVGSRLKVVRLEPEASRTRASYVEHPFRLEFRGSLGSLASFLRGLENDRRVYAIEELQIQRPGNEVSVAELEGVYRFSVFAALNGSEKLSKEVRSWSRL